MVGPLGSGGCGDPPASQAASPGHEQRERDEPAGPRRLPRRPAATPVRPRNATVCPSSPLRASTHPSDRPVTGHPRVVPPSGRVRDPYDSGCVSGPASLRCWPPSSWPAAVPTPTADDLRARARARRRRPAPTVDPPDRPASRHDRRSRSPGRRQRHAAAGQKIAPTLLPSARRGRLPAAPAHRRPAARPRRRPGLVGGRHRRPRHPSPTGACQKTSLVDIGAVHAVRRDFAGPDGSGVAARQIVAKFADAKSAWRAEQVLRAWRDDCEERLDYPRKDGRPAGRRSRPTPAAAGHYRLTYGSRRATDAAGTGIVRNGPLAHHRRDHRRQRRLPDATGTPPAARYAGSRRPSPDGRLRRG